MPALGESVTEGTVSSWLKAVGDTVEADEPLLEVATDKVDTEVPSPASGVLLEIRVPEDETVEVGTVLAIIGDPSEASPAAPTKAKWIIAGALIYFLSPIDSIPDILVPLGFTDDIAVLALAYAQIKAYLTADILARAQAAADELLQR